MPFSRVARNWDIPMVISGDDFAPVYMMMAFALISFLAVLHIPETLARAGKG